ncbi:MAG: histidine phosphatase family protein [Blautia sp.]|nr:histidine phosphatase family protein [Blautia sp.]MDY3999777.1 histidine phosphatase family protein [Blautia sp.]
MLIYIIRHGVTEWNALKKVQGIADIPLAEEGIRLARETGEALKEIPFDICFTSPLVRARRTAELVLGSRCSSVPIIEDPRIREINFGILEGTRFKDEKGKVVNEQMEIFFNDPEHFERPDQGENIRDICARTREFWLEKMMDPSLADKTVLIASHGCAVRALLRNVYPEGTPFWNGCVPPNCAVNIVRVDEDGTCLLAQDKIFHTGC